MPVVGQREPVLLLGLHHILPYFGKMPLSSIEQIDVKGWVADLDAKDLAPATVRKAYQLFEKVIQGAVDARYIPQSPCRSGRCLRWPSDGRVGRAATMARGLASLRGPCG